jgi:hypothetical protein
MRLVDVLFALAGRLFLEAGLPGALGKHGFHLRKRDAAHLQQHQQVIEEIGRLGDQPTAAIVTSTASSPSFLAQCATPLSTSVRV